MKIQILIALIPTVLAAGCANPESSLTPAVDELHGAWQSNCVKGQLSRTLTAPVKFGVTQYTQLHVKNGKFTETARVTSGECDSSDVEVTVSGELAKSKSPESPMTDLDLRIDSYRVRPITEFGVRVMNLRRWCGMSNWILNDEREVTLLAGGKDCFPLLRQLSTVYSIEDGKLYFGDRSSTRPEAERPKSLQRDFYFTRLGSAAVTKSLQAGRSEK
jgi:hypothetical protein